MTHLRTVCFALLFVFSNAVQASIIPEGSPKDVLDALVSGRAGDLEQYYSDIAGEQQESGSDYAQFNAYKIFKNSNPELRQPLDNWVNQFPASPHALTARGLHQFAVAMQHRGTRKISNTPAARIKRMQVNMDQAQSDFSAAVERAPDFTVPVAGLIDVYKVTGNRGKLERLAREALILDPGSYAIRYTYLKAQDPKWGGTFESLMAFIDDTAKYTARNPDLGTLHGFGYATIAAGYSENSDHDKAVRFAGQAADLGLNEPELLRIAKIHFHAGKFGEAGKYLDRALGLYPARVESMYWKGRIASHSGDIDSADRWYRQALEINPVDTDTLRAQAKIFMARGDYAAAEANYARAITHYAARDTGMINEYMLMLVSSSKNYQEADRVAEQSWELFKGSGELFWYSWGVALAGEKDCKTVAAMKRYQQNCAGMKNLCDASALKSAEKQIRAVVDPGTCEDMPPFSM